MTSTPHHSAFRINPLNSITGNNLNEESSVHRGAQSTTLSAINRNPEMTVDSVRSLLYRTSSTLMLHP
jgi:hypothetical protein